jgi:hypothetical protein
MPNWKKKRPMMPLMNAIGMNTGHDREGRRHDREADLVGPFERRRAVVLAHRQVPHDVLAHDDRVVDQEADAQRQRHQRQEVEREPERVERDERRDDGSGSVIPVMTVLRHECRNRNTIRTVRSPPSTIVDLTRLTLFSTWSDVALTTRTSTSEGSRSLRSATAWRTLRPGLDDVGVLRLAHVDRDRLAAVDARVALELLLAVDDVRDLRQVDRPAALLRDDDAAELLGSLILPSTRTTASVCPRVRRPAGTSWLASRIACTTWSTPMPSAVSAWA